MNRGLLKSSQKRINIRMASRRTLASKSPLDTAESRKVLASIKRGLRGVKRDVQALQPMANQEPEPPITWDIDERPAAVISASGSNTGKR